jgi:hypothetical protein
MSTATKTHPAYEAMKTIANTTIRAFREDFTTHDAGHLSELATIDTRIPFVWCARECGSHMFSKRSVEIGVSTGWTGHSRCIRTVARMEQNWSGWYIWNGYRFSKVTLDTAEHVVAQWEKNAPKETDEARDRRYRRGGW